MLNYVKESKKYILLSLSIFLAFFVLGIGVALAFPQTVDVLKNIADGIDTSAPSWQLAIVIFLNNAIKNFVLSMGGVCVGFGPVLMLSVNGLILGIAAVFVAQKDGILYFIVGISPHGIIELPMLIWSCAIGLRLGHKTCLGLLQRIGKEELVHEIKMGATQFIYIIPLLGVAALIEAFITPVLLSWV